MYNGIVVRASSLVVITDEGLLRLIDSDCTHWAKGNKMTASRITHLITSCTKGKHFQCGSRAELSIRAGETPEEAMASWAARHCCKVSDEAAFCLIQRPYISKTLLTRRISPRGSP